MGIIEIGNYIWEGTLMQVNELVKPEVMEKLSEIKPKEFATKNLLIACILLAKNMRYIRTEGEKFPRKFVFEDRTDREQIINDFINGTLDVNIANFIRARKMLLTTFLSKEA